MGEQTGIGKYKDNLERSQSHQKNKKTKKRGKNRTTRTRLSKRARKHQQNNEIEKLNAGRGKDRKPEEKLLRTQEEQRTLEHENKKTKNKKIKNKENKTQKTGIGNRGNLERN